ncbi:hypothetical protein ACFW04_014346 [Cataglyphis niger]
MLISKLARVVFIPKVGRTCYTSAKDFRPISLTLFLLKTLEKLVETYLNDVVLGRHPLHGNQYVYRMDFSTETALHSLVCQIERDLMEEGYSVRTFLDIEGIFNNTSHEMVCREAVIRGMFRRRVVTTLGIVSVGGWVARGCPQGGVLSPLLCCLVIDGLLSKLNDKGFFAQGYVDDLAIVTSCQKSQLLFSFFFLLS